MPFTVRLGRLEITCDTLGELEAALGSPKLKDVHLAPLPLVEQRGKPRTKRAERIAAHWARVKELAEAEGISVQAARQRLKKT